MIWECAFGPSLYKFWDTTWKSYEPRIFERWGDNVVASFAAVWSISFYVFPLVAAYRRNYSLADNTQSLLKFAAGAGMILITSLAARGFARANNPTYVKFIKILNNARDDDQYSRETKQELLKYDFNFKEWPVEYKNSAPPPEKIGGLDWVYKRDGVTLLFCKLAAYVVAHTVALKLMYPGSMTLINWAMRPTLLEGRIELLDKFGQRYKLLSSDANEIDVMFMERRFRTSNGDVLVITCEGNCGFYEIGILTTSLQKGYSVLGWNHPGFGGSTGQPFPMQERAAIDCVIQFAIEKLGFQVQQIILHGWSIGGYTATWAAVNYPEIKSLILDATFDDVLPLAIARMPRTIECIVRTAIRDHLNLNVAEQLNQYNGTVLIIRRTEDEIMCTPHSSLMYNRANELLTKLLVRRHPHLFIDCHESLVALKEYLVEAHDSPNAKEIAINNSIELECLEEISLYNEKEKASSVSAPKYPSRLGNDASKERKANLVKFLARKYMEDQASQHCQPLAEELFHPGWDETAVKIAPKKVANET